MSATTTSRRRRGACAASTSRCCSGENPAVSPGCGARLRTRTLRASLSTRALNSSGTSRWGRTLENHDPGPRVMTSAERRASHASGHARGRRGSSRTLLHPPRRGGDRDLPADPVGDVAPLVAALGAEDAGDVGLDVHRLRAHRQHPAAHPEQAARLVEGGHRVVEDLEQAGEHAGCRRRGPRAPRARRSGARRPAATSVFSGPGFSWPASAPSAIRRSPSGRMSSSRRIRPDEPPSSATDHDGRDVVGQPAQRRERRVQPVRPHPRATAFTRAPRRGATP